MHNHSPSISGKSLIIRADANSEIGIGHVMRCLALAQEWTDKGGKAVFAGNITNEPLIKKLKNCGFEYIPIIKSYPESSSDAVQLIQAAKAAPAGSWIVLDGYFFDTQYQSLIRSIHPDVMVIDDYHHLDSYDARIILNQNLGSETIAYKTNGKASVLSGSRYAMLRKEFRNTSSTSGQVNNYAATKILISMGGADTHNASLSVLKALSSLEDKTQVTLIVGPANPHLNSLEQFSEVSTLKFSIKSNVENMAEIIAENDIFIGAGGSSCWEVCCLAKPLIIITTAENQVRLSHKLAEAEAAIYLGKAENVERNEIQRAVASLISSPEARKKLTDNARTIIDGKGVSRIVETLAANSSYISQTGD